METYVIYAATGHRPNKLGNEYQMVGPYSDFIRKEIKAILLHDKPNVIISGMALGVDMIFAQCGIDLGIPVIAAIPFKGQESKWPFKSIRVYQNILANKLVCQKIVSEGDYSAAKMQTRNEWMVDNCDVLVAVWDGTPGGTGNCVKYAESKNKKILYISKIGK